LTGLREASSSRASLERLRRVCLALPEGMEQEAWGEPTFRVRKKIFAMYAGANQHGQGRCAVWCKAPLGVQEIMVRSDPDRFFVPPYVGVKGWIGIDIEAVDDRELTELVLQSYCMIAPAKLQVGLRGL
jgi:hypothetical protein